MKNIKPVSNFDKKPKSKIILYCFLMISIGLILGYFFIYQKIEYSYKAIALSPISLSMGLCFLFFRINNDGHFKDLQPKDKKIFVGAIVFMGLILFLRCYENDFVNLRKKDGTFKIRKTR